MQAVLNFSQAERQKVLGFLNCFERLEKKNEFEEARYAIEDYTITLYSSGKLLIQGNSAEKVKEKILAEIGLTDDTVLGIDEAGRGESFGPLVIAGVLGNINKLRELRDSKKTRNIAEKKEIVLQNCLASFVISVSASEIDKMRSAGKNLNEIEAEAIDAIVSSAKKAHGAMNFRIVVDGNPLPAKEKDIEFLPKADDLNPLVGAASVLAKATREESNDKTKRNSWKSAA